VRHFDFWHACPRWRRRIGHCPFFPFDGEKEREEEDAPITQPTGQEALAAAEALVRVLAGVPANESLEAAAARARVSIGARSESGADAIGIPFESESGRVTVPVARVPGPLAEPLPSRGESFLDRLLSNPTIADAIMAAAVASGVTGAHGTIRKGVSGLGGRAGGLRVFDSAKELSEALGFAPERSIRNLAESEDLAARVSAAGLVDAPRGQRESDTASALVGGIAEFRDRTFGGGGGGDAPGTPF